jgi:hypothetical protein
MDATCSAAKCVVHTLAAKSERNFRAENSQTNRQPPISRASPANGKARRNIGTCRRVARMHSGQKHRSDNLGSLPPIPRQSRLHT